MNLWGCEIKSKQADGVKTGTYSPGKYLCHLSARMLSADRPAAEELLELTSELQANWSTKEVLGGGSREPPA